MRVGPKTVVVITGGANGIGRALANECSARRAPVALIDNDVAGLASVASTLPNCTSHVCDVSDANAVLNVAQAIAGLHQRVDILINNAGISVAGAVEALPIEQFQRAMDVNFWGVLHCSRAFLPHLRTAVIHNQSAAICNVLSEFSLVSLPTKAAYAASKHAARAFTEALQAELYQECIKVTAAYVGATATDLVLRGFATDPAKQQREHEFLATKMSPAHVASRIIHGIEAGRMRLLIGNDARLLDAAARLSPRLLQFALKKLWRHIPFL